MKPTFVRLVNQLGLYHCEMFTNNQSLADWADVPNTTLR